MAAICSRRRVAAIVAPASSARAAQAIHASVKKVVLGEEASKERPAYGAHEQAGHHHADSPGWRFGAALHDGQVEAAGATPSRGSRQATPRPRSHPARRP
jgi:hypothetical protein